MNLKFNYCLDFGKRNEDFLKLLLEEDYDFRTKEIFVDIKKGDSGKVEIECVCGSILDMKIAISAIIKSLEVIDKTMSL